MMVRTKRKQIVGNTKLELSTVSFSVPQHWSVPVLYRDDPLPVFFFFTWQPWSAYLQLAGSFSKTFSETRDLNTAGRVGASSEEVASRKSQILPFLCTAVHVIIFFRPCSRSFSISFYWSAYRYPRQDDKEIKKKIRKRVRLHELPYTEMVKSGTIRLASGHKDNYLTTGWNITNNLHKKCILKIMFISIVFSL